MASSYYWVVWSPDNTASVSGPGAKPAAPKGGKVFGPYNTQAEAQQGVALAQKAKGASGSLSNAVKTALSPSTLTSGLTSGLSQSFGNVTGFFGALTQGSTWVRVGEVVLGLILVAVGLARITHAVPIATKVATTVGAVAI